ncbi:MAG: hypothetical protein JNL09_00830 [Anaerolineales bacterium]|nr:hypothetical protein [Anaerolineales bacterium]
MVTLAALGVLLLFALVLVFFSVAARRPGAKPIGLRELAPLNDLPTQIGEAVESGRRLHVSVGSGALGQTETVTMLAGLNTASQIAGVAAISDRPPVITSADGASALLTHDVLRQIYREQNASERYTGNAAQVVGLSPLSMAAGLTPLVKDDAIASNLIIGPVGPEVALLTEASQRQKVATLGASSDLSGQAVLLATADQTLLGEDVYASGAYLSQNPGQVAALRAQDVLRWMVIVGMVVGVVLKSLGLI